MKMIALALAGVLFSSTAFAQGFPNGGTVGFVYSFPAGSTTGQLANTAVNNSNNQINTFQSLSPGIPAGTNQQIDMFQVGNTVPAGNPAPNVTVPFSINLGVFKAPLAN